MLRPVRPCCAWKHGLKRNKEHQRCTHKGAPVGVAAGVAMLRMETRTTTEQKHINDSSTKAHPLVLRPVLAMLQTPGRSCLSDGTISSSKSPPQMDSPPVPSPRGSPARGYWGFTWLRGCLLHVVARVSPAKWQRTGLDHKVSKYPFFACVEQLSTMQQESNTAAHRSGS